MMDGTVIKMIRAPEIKQRNYFKTKLKQILANCEIWLISCKKKEAPLAILLKLAEKLL